MKLNFLRIIIFIFLIGTTATAHAGFVFKRNTAIIESVTAASEISKPIIAIQKPSEAKQEGDNQHQRQKRKPSESGWEGITALVCAVTGMVIPGIGILGVIFGALGMGKGHKHRGMAIAGFVIGLVQLFFIALIITILAMSYG